MSSILINVIVGAVCFVVGFFFSRANGAGTDADKVASKVDAKWDEKVKPVLTKLEEEVKNLKEKIK